MAYKIISEGSVGYRGSGQEGVSLLVQVSRPRGLHIEQKLLSRCAPELVETTLLAHHSDPEPGITISLDFATSVLVEVIVREGTGSRRLAEEYLALLSDLLMASRYDLAEVGQALTAIKKWAQENDPENIGW